jgi:hypothetical protein
MSPLTNPTQQTGIVISSNPSSNNTTSTYHTPYIQIKLPTKRNYKTNYTPNTYQRRSTTKIYTPPIKKQTNKQKHSCMFFL